MALNILLVDDSITVRAILAKTLSLAGVPINALYEASNGKEALKTITERDVDLVFADINMPVMDGIEMVDKMSEHGLLKSIPVIVISTEGSSTRIERLKAKGVGAYVRKPFTPEHLREVVFKIVTNLEDKAGH